MAFSPRSTNGGGFVRDVLLSPAPSSVTSASSMLPSPRAQPLKPGGPKESALIRHIDTNILRIRRRFAKRGTDAADAEEDVTTRGYESFNEAAKDIEKLFDLLWVSGTPSVQVPYLLTLASMIEQFLPGFDAAPRPTFKLLERFDLALASLLQQKHAETGEVLPGFATGRKVTGTEKVRMKSIVERTRSVVSEVMSKDADEEDEENRVEDVSEHYNETGDDTSDEMDVDRLSETGEEHFSGIEMNIAKVYDRTMVELGDTIGATPIGIISDD